MSKNAHRTAEHLMFLETLVLLETPVHQGREWQDDDGTWHGPVGRSTHLHRQEGETDDAYLERLYAAMEEVLDEPIVQAKLSGKVAVIDIDDPAKEDFVRAELERRGIRVYAETASPRDGGAGRHLYVARSAGLRACAGVGPWEGVEIKANCSITTPGSVRPKPAHAGRPYALLVNRLDALATEGPQPGAVEALDALRADMVGKTEKKKKSAARLARPEHVDLRELPPVEWDLAVVTENGGTEAQTRVVTRWLERNWAELVSTPEGAGYNDALNSFTYGAALWTPIGLAEWWPEAAAEAACGAVFGGTDASDSATISSALRAQEESGAEQYWPDVRVPTVDPDTGEVVTPAPTPALAPPTDEPLAGEVVGVAPSTAVTGQVMAATLREAIATGQPHNSDPVELVGGGRCFVKHDPSSPDQHGTWVSKRVTDDQGNVQWTAQRVADYYAWQAERRIEPGDHLEGEQVRVRCQVVTANGVYTTGWLTDEHATSTARVVRASGARVSLPGRGAAGEVMASALLTTAATECQVIRPLRTVGWHTVDGRATWVGAVGSVTSDGATTSVVAEPCRGMDGSAIDYDAVARVGFDRTSDRVGEMVTAWLGLGDRRVTLALLGTEVAARLHMSARHSILLVGATGTGKSETARRARGWSTATPVSTADLTFDLRADGDSVAGAAAIEAYLQDCVIWADDLRGRVDGKSNGERLGAHLAQTALGLRSVLRSGVAGGTRGAARSRYAAVTTAERLPGGGEEAIVNRYLTLRFDQTTMSWPAGIEYGTAWVDTGEARAAMARVVQHLAARADRLGGPAALGREADERRLAEQARLSEMTPAAVARSIAMAASVSTGLAYLRDALEELGQGDALPTRDEVDEVLVSIIEDSSTTSRDQSPAQVLVEWVGTQLAAGRAVLTGADGQAVPVTSGWATATGWGIGDSAHLGSRPVLGRLSVDGEHAVLTNAALTEAIRLCPELQGMPLRQLQQLMGEATEDRVGGYTDPRHGGTRVRGYVVRLEALGVERDGRQATRSVRAA